MKVGAGFGAATMHGHAIGGGAHATDELSAADASEGGKSRGREGARRGMERRRTLRSRDWLLRESRHRPRRCLPPARNESKHSDKESIFVSVIRNSFNYIISFKKFYQSPARAETARDTDSDVAGAEREEESRDNAFAAAAADVGENDIVRSVRFVSPPRFFRLRQRIDAGTARPTDGNSVEVENGKMWRMDSLAVTLTPFSFSQMCGWRPTRRRTSRSPTL